MSPAKPAITAISEAFFAEFSANSVTECSNLYIIIAGGVVSSAMETMPHILIVDDDREISEICLPDFSNATVSCHVRARRARGATSLATRQLPVGRARSDATRRRWVGRCAVAAHAVRHSDCHADRDGRGDGPHYRPGAWGRRLYAQALQSARIAGPYPRGFAPQHPSVASRRPSCPPRASASMAGCWSPRAGG